MVPDVNLRTSAAKFKSEKVPYFALGVGYYAMNNLRVEMTFDHFFSPTLEYKDITRSNFNINSLLLNAYIDLFDLSIAKIFIGAGAGGARIYETLDVKDVSSPLASSTRQKIKSINNFSYTLRIGASVELAPGIHSELFCSFINFGKSNYVNNFDLPIKAHNIAIGIRFDM